MSLSLLTYLFDMSSFNKCLRLRTTFFLSSDEDGLRSLCSEGDLGGFLPGEPREVGGLVESFGDGSGPANDQRQAH